MIEARAELMSQALSRYIESSQNGSVAALLNSYQVNVAKSVSESWMASQKGHVKAPTGEGKTVMQAAIIEGTKSVEPSSKTLIVVPRVHLIRQTIDEIRQKISGANVTPYYGAKKDSTGDIVVTTYPSMIR